LVIAICLPTPFYVVFQWFEQGRYSFFAFCFAELNVEEAGFANWKILKLILTIAVRNLDFLKWNLSVWLWWLK